MVGYYQAYKGSTQTPLIYSGSNMVRKVYKGSTLVYQVGFDPITYNVSDSIQEFTVPLGVKKIHVDCVASKGANGGSTGGKGGRVQCDLKVTGGQTLYITVGGIPSGSLTQAYNASDIRTNNAGITNTTSLQSRLVVAGGGGNGGRQGGHNHKGGAGGGLIGGAAPNHLSGGGQGGTQTAGGAHGVYISGSLRGQSVGTNGYFGLGGTGGAACGGAGWYGGGAGFSGDYSSFGVDNAGGGGGSSYTDSSLCSNIIHTQGYKNGSGYVTISFVE